MKLCKFVLFLFFFSCSVVLTIPKNPSFEIERIWKELDPHPKLKSSFMEDKWAIIGYILICSRDFFLIDKLKFKWTGKNLDNVSFSIYKDSKNAEPLLIEDNFIGDGIWQSQKQRVKFILKEKVGTRSRFYLVANFKDSQKTLLKEGNFEILF